MEPTKCRMLITYGGRTAHYNVDLLLRDGEAPLAVLEWADYPDGTSIPGVAVELEPRYLHRIPGWEPVTHMYEIAIESPIPPR